MWIPLLPVLRVPYSNRTWGRHDAVICVRDNLGIQKVNGWSGHRGRAESRCAVSSAAVLDWAWIPLSCELRAMSCEQSILRSLIALRSSLKFSVATSL
jgi:hypothetical protein